MTHGDSFVDTEPRLMAVFAPSRDAKIPLLTRFPFRSGEDRSCHIDPVDGSELWAHQLFTHITSAGWVNPGVHEQNRDKTLRDEA